MQVTEAIQISIKHNIPVTDYNTMWGIEILNYALYLIEEYMYISTYWS